MFRIVCVRILELAAIGRSPTVAVCHYTIPCRPRENTMITFASFPPLSQGISENSDGHYEQDEDMEMDLDSGDVGHTRRLTYPGETLTSSQAFMR